MLATSSIINTTIGKSPEIEYPHNPDCPRRLLAKMFGAARYLSLV